MASFSPVAICGPSNIWRHLATFADINGSMVFRRRRSDESQCFQNFCPLYYTGNIKNGLHPLSHHSSDCYILTQMDSSSSGFALTRKGMRVGFCALVLVSTFATVSTRWKFSWVWLATVPTDHFRLFQTGLPMTWRPPYTAMGCRLSPSDTMRASSDRNATV